MTDNEAGGAGGAQGAPGADDWPEPGQGAQAGQGMWQPVPHGGEYDADATAFVQLPQEDDTDAPLAAPGHGYVPPMITPLQPDPSVAGTWGVPDPQAEAAQEQQYPGTYGQDPYAAHQVPGTDQQSPYGPHDPYAQAAAYGQAPYGQAPYGQGGDPYAHVPQRPGTPSQDPYEQGPQSPQAQDPATPPQGMQVPPPQSPGPQSPRAATTPPQDPYVTGQWDFSEATADSEPAAPASAPAAPAPDAPAGATSSWRIPLVTGGVADDSGELSAALAASPWSGGIVPPPTLPGGARAPWAPEPAEGAEQPSQPGPVPEQNHPENHPQDPHQLQLAQDFHPEPRQDPDPEPGPHDYPQQYGQEEVQHTWAHTDDPAPQARGGSRGDAFADFAAGPDTVSPGHGQDHGGEAAAATASADPRGTAEPVRDEAAEPVGDEAADPAPAARQQRAPQEPDPHAHPADPAASAGSQPVPVPNPATPPGATPEEPERTGLPEPTGGTDDAPGPYTTAATAATPTPAPTPHPDRTQHPDPVTQPDAAPRNVANEEVEHPSFSYVLKVNGEERPVNDAWIGESLLYVLRERLGLAGAKDGCSQGECGACNVQVDGRLVASCLVPAATAAGSEVRTVEGLATNGEPSDVQRALATCGAVQCGFCIPGMAMTAHDLLEGNHAPTELETRQALSGNLCRCSGYRGVLDAVHEVAEARAAATEAAAAAAHPPAQDPAGPLNPVPSQQAPQAPQAPDEARIPHQAPPGAGGVRPAHSPQNPQHPNPPHPDDGGMA